jgi:hypothetical protein
MFGAMYLFLSVSVVHQDVHKKLVIRWELFKQQVELTEHCATDFLCKMVECADFDCTQSHSWASHSGNW